MQLSASLNLKQKQSLVMTPQLQQAIRLLQMTNLDLRQYLETECSENPFLEVDVDSETTTSTDSAEPALEKSDREENTSSTAIDNVLTEGTALTDDPTSNSDYENRFETEITDYKTPKSSTSQNDDYDFMSFAVSNQKVLRSLCW